MNKPSKKFQKKIKALEVLIKADGRPEFFPRNIIQFANWEDPSLGIETLTRTLIYKVENKDLRAQCVQLINVCIDRWHVNPRARNPELVILRNQMKSISGQWHIERQARIDCENRCAALESANKSLMEQLSLQLMK